MTDIQTIRMAVAALRSAADDLMKSDPTLSLHVELGSATRAVIQTIIANEPVRVWHLGLLVKDLAARIEDNYR